MSLGVQGAHEASDAGGRAIVEALGGRWTAKGAMCRCPAHADRTPSLSVRPGQRRLLFHCFAGCASSDVIAALRALHLPALTQFARPSTDAQAQERSHDLAQRLWSEARALGGTRAERYLAARGLGACGRLRFHARTPRGRYPLTTYRPALLAPVHAEKGLVAVHRTFLPGTSWAPGTRVERAALGRLGDGAVRLAAPHRVLGLAEGLETALSAMRLFGVPVWATLGTERFRRLTIPDPVERLILFLDHDEGGRRAEALARSHFRDRAIAVRYPAHSNWDWNDVLLAPSFRAIG